MEKNQLIQKIKVECEDAVNTLFDELKAYPWSNKVAYGNWLAQSFYYVTHTTRMLALAGAHCTPEDNKLHQKFLDHAAEEKSHERLCINDLKKLNMSPTDFPELPQTASIYHALYYLIQKKHPISIMGFAMVLEGVSAIHGDQLLSILGKHYEKSACTFLSVHCEVDKDHSKESATFLESCTKEQLEAILHGIHTIKGLYPTMLRACITSLEEVDRRRAA